MTHKIEWVIQTKCHPDGDWFDWAYKDSRKLVLSRLKTIRDERPNREFRAIRRAIVDTEIK